MGTWIVSNGSKTRGDGPDGLDALLARLESDTLDPRFEWYGNFVNEADPVLEPGVIQFMGNFITYSHVFDVRTDEPEVIARLTAAIRANQARPAYLAALQDERERRGQWAAVRAAEEAKWAARAPEPAAVALSAPPPHTRSPDPAQGSLF